MTGCAVQGISLAQFRTTRTRAPVTTEASTRSTNISRPSTAKASANVTLLSQLLSRTIVIQLAGGITGGPEAVVQLALAVQDAHGVKLGCLGRFNSFYASEYLDLWHNLPNCSMSVTDLNRHDVVVVPEIAQCAPMGKVRTPHIWLLGPVNMGPDDCPRLSHNYWLARHAHIRKDAILFPYVTPSIVKHAVEKAGLLPDGSFKHFPDLARQKEPIVLVDNDAVPIFGSVSQQLKNANINVIVVAGYSRNQLLQLQLKAKVVVDLCMRGTERMPLESILHGAIFFTNDCQTGSDKDDFPVSEKHRSFSAEGILHAIRNYAEEVMDPGQVKLRRLYGFEINRESMARNVERWSGRAVLT